MNFKLKEFVLIDTNLYFRLQKTIRQIIDFDNRFYFTININGTEKLIFLEKELKKLGPVLNYILNEEKI